MISLEDGEEFFDFLFGWHIDDFAVEFEHIIFAVGWMIRIIGFDLENLLNISDIGEHECESQFGKEFLSFVHHLTFKRVSYSGRLMDLPSLVTEA